ncbi:hypothetical protein LCGC14_0514310 [marine sediment metagenome]|uniref:Uncharacterized protein n=1 Tax=marine sediment metagenome TaxID=412755 RepID=A0A0F9SIK9_9ZZZZ
MNWGIIVLFVWAWIALGLISSYIGWKGMCARFGYESFLHPFYIIMAILFGPINIVGVLLIKWWVR